MVVSDDFFAFAVGAVRGFRWSWDFLQYVITDIWNFAMAPGPSGGRGEIPMSPPRCAPLFSPHSDSSRDVGARCSECPTGACSSSR